MRSLRSVCGQLGFAYGMVMFLAPGINSRKIIKTGSTGKFSGVPYVLALITYLLSFWYGLPFLSPNNELFSAMYGTGAVIDSVLLAIFLLYASKKEKGKILILLSLVLAFLAGLALVSIFALHGYNRKVFSGIVAAAYTIVVYSSPLTSLMLTRSLETVPFLPSLLTFFFGTYWLIFGLLGSDLFIAIPNGFICGFGAIQLLINVIYEDRINPPGEANGPVEMAKADAKDELV